ncbi:LysR family transcriptional regulator [Floricoccus penangensis]|uniref:LysR family transcriptional regulator n=1 Tax=Floricoccus penangensis TaxID=1859475 RepID=A0A9Q5P0I1_9LACT|nr:LysR family transcriptional regulator [Floricoccus penangensis]OFI46996.1 LysR family transcriptional regulator [Floricoccus penangensis]
MLDWIKTFIAVYETKNFSFAAEKLYISQPTVSLQIKKLEQNYGIQLFHRNGKQNVVPTKEADFLYPKLLTIIENLSNSFEQVMQKENFKEECIIVCSNTVANHILPKLMTDILKTFPNVNFTIKMMNSKMALEQIQNNHAHIAIIEKPIETPNLKKEVIYEDELVLAGNADSKYWLMREKESGTRFFNEIFMNENNIQLPIINIDSNELLEKLIEEGIGQSIISRLATNDKIKIQKKVNSRKIFLIPNPYNSSIEISKISELIKNLMKDF